MWNSWQKILAALIYDHIIRDENDLENVRGYIRNNALKWESDQENPHTK